MKFLVENYATNNSTQALYLAKTINASPEHQASLWNGSASIYDIMDKEKPDYYITSAHKLSRDFVHYTKNVRSIGLILSVDGLDQSSISSLEESMYESGIDCAFFFSSDPNIKTKKYRFVQMLNAYDDNLVRNNDGIKYKIDKAVFVNDKEDVKEYEGTYHFISNDTKISDVADITLPENMLFILFKNYDTVIFKNIKNSIPQSFFDAIMQSNKVYYENIDDNTKEMLNKVLQTTGSLDYNDPNKIQDFSEIKKHILNKHTPSNRAKKILSQLPKE